MKKTTSNAHSTGCRVKPGLKKKMTLLLTLLVSLYLQASAVSQSKRVFIELAEVPVADVLSEIERISDFKFLVNRADVDLNRIVTVSAKNQKISEILEEVFSGRSVEIEVLNKQIILRNSKSNLDSMNDSGLGGASGTKQQQTVSGTVTDGSGLPLVGANVVEKGTTNGVMTDFDGNFTLNLESETALLAVSFIGFESKEVSVTAGDNITVSLKESAANLEEVVIVGYGTQRKTDLTGAISSVKAEDFAPGANYDATQLLNGSAAGVNVSQTSSAPGAGLRVQVRGAGSINSSNDVLFVVDGLPGVDPATLSPEDIESIDVLKDASSASIYGTRASNGVVLITTKKGRAGKATFSYSNYAGMQVASNRLDVLDAPNYMRLVNQRSVIGGNDPVYTDAEIGNIGPGTDWQDEIFKSALVQNHQISLSGGDDRSNYYVGLNYFDQDGIVKSSSYQKYNLRVNVQTRPLERLLVSANMNFTRESRNRILTSNLENEGAGPLNSAIQFDPTLPAGLNGDGRYFLNPTIALDNPVALIEGITDKSIDNSFYGTVNTDYEVFDNLTATVRLGVEANNGRSDFYRDRQTIAGFASGGIAEVESEEYTHWLTEALLKYENVFAEKHNFSLTVGGTLEEFLTRELGGESQNFLSDVTGTDLLQSGDGDLGDNVSSSKVKNQLNGFLGRMTYGFDNKYLLTASLRVDGSSRFSDDNKYGYFPSVSLGWRIGEESFLEKAGWINELKLRAGYGELGNQGINNFETRQTLVAAGDAVYVTEEGIFQGVVPARLPNPDLKWETTAETNIGLDYAFADGRISGSLDYFNRKTTDQLFQEPLPSVVGFSSVRTNLGEVINEGVDLNLRTLNIDREFKWDSNLTFTYLDNQVTELPEGTEEIIRGSVGSFITQFTIVREGETLNSFYGYAIDGIFQEGDDIENTAIPDVEGYEAGMPRFVDQNDDGVIDSEDRVILGDPIADITFGFANNFTYKNLSLNVFITGVQGIETLDANVTESLYPTNAARNSISRYYLDRWTPDNPSNTLPSGNNPSLYGGARAINSLTVVDASFVRLKNVTLNYNVPLSEKSSISSLGIFIAADNLATITGFEGYDPDASALGGVSRASYNSYPLARVFRMGLNVNF